jgi:hypothetical protein
MASYALVPGGDGLGVLRRVWRCGDVAKSRKFRPLRRKPDRRSQRATVDDRLCDDRDGLDASVCDRVGIRSDRRAVPSYGGKRGVDREVISQLDRQSLWNCRLS